MKIFITRKELSKFSSKMTSAEVCFISKRLGACVCGEGMYYIIPCYLLVSLWVLKHLRGKFQYLDIRGS